MPVGNLAHRIFGAAANAQGDRRGAVAIVVALMAPVLVGALAVVVDAAYWRSRSYYIQAAADSAAIAASLDLNNGITGPANTARIVANATVEARRMCGNCTVQVSYPYNSDPNKVRIQVTDTNAIRFFSGFYDRSARSLQASAIAQRVGSTTTTKSGSACILALSTAQSFSSGIYMQNNGASIGPTDCEVIANNTGSQAAYVDANAVINAPLTVSGNVRFLNGGRATGIIKTNQTATADPYLGKVSMRRSAMNLTRNYNTSGAFSCFGLWSDPYNVQRTVLNGNGVAGSPGSGSSNNVISPGNSQQRMNGGQFRWNSTDNSWHLAQDFSPSGIRAWFCNGFQASNTTITLDPGTYIFSNDVNFQNVTVRGNGATIIIANDLYNWNWQSSTFTMTAPPSGVPSDASLGLSGIVLSQFTDDTSGKLLELYSNIVFEFTGAVYLPTKSFRVQNTGVIRAVSGANGCGHIIIAGIVVLNGVNLGNNCTVAMGVQPFGTVDGQGWYSTTTSTGGGGGRLIQ